MTKEDIFLLCPTLGSNSIVVFIIIVVGKNVADYFARIRLWPLPFNTSFHGVPSLASSIALQILCTQHIAGDEAQPSRERGKGRVPGLLKHYYPIDLSLLQPFKYANYCDSP